MWDSDCIFCLVVVIGEWYCIYHITYYTRQILDEVPLFCVGLYTVCISGSNEIYN